MADAHQKHHDYHLVDPSPWPILGSLGAFILAVGAIAWMKTGLGGSLDIGSLSLKGSWLFVIGFVGVLLVMILWWRDVIKEAHRGDHTPVVQLHLRYGMMLFIASEVMFFVAWFWGFFDIALFPGEVHTLQNSTEVIGLTDRTALTGGHWPPQEHANFQKTFDPWGLPLINTLILLISGTTVTWAHHALLENNRRGLIWGLALTVVLGIFFTVLQVVEYAEAAFTFPGHIYGATFFMATGFHGFHVIIGTIFLMVCLGRAVAGHFTPKQHFGFEAAAWYWHFVDVVWLFLFAAIYVWAGGSAGGH